MKTKLYNSRWEVGFLLISIMFLVFAIDSNFNSFEKKVLESQGVEDYLEEWALNPYISNESALGFKVGITTTYMGDYEHLTEVFGTSFAGLFEGATADIYLVRDRLTNEEWLERYNDTEISKKDLLLTYIHEWGHKDSLVFDSRYETISKQFNLFNPEEPSLQDRRKYEQVINETKDILVSENIEEPYLSDINFTKVFYDSDYYGVESYYREIIARVYSYCLVENPEELNRFIVRENSEFCEYFNFNSGEVVIDGIVKNFNNFHEELIRQYYNTINDDNGVFYVFTDKGEFEIGSGSLESYFNTSNN